MQPGQPAKNLTPIATAHSWFSNPLDWRSIDRLILLSGMTLLIPLFFGGALALTLILAPEWLNASVARPLLLFYGVYLAMLGGMVLHAFKLRKTTDRWPLFESFLIYSYVAVTFVQSWFSGTHFTSGMLLLMVGVYMASALADIRKIYRAYIIVAVLFTLVCIAEGSGKFRFAPVFARSPYNPDGSSVTAWFAIQVIQISALIILTRIGIMATRRWVERENLFREMSTVDGLTRLTNRRSFLERSETEFARASRVPETGISCVMMDIDFFKKINDTRGHHAGDAVLVQTAALLLAQARPYDEVARYGGEEFAILLPETSLEDAAKIAERLREGIASQNIVVEGKPVPVTASFGVASYPAPGIETISDLLKAADKALYKAKYSGRNRVVATRKTATPKAKAARKPKKGKKR